VGPDGPLERGRADSITGKAVEAKMAQHYEIVEAIDLLWTARADYQALL